MALDRLRSIGIPIKPGARFQAPGPWLVACLILSPQRPAAPFHLKDLILAHDRLDSRCVAPAAPCPGIDPATDPGMDSGAWAWPTRGVPGRCMTIRSAAWP